MTQSRKFPLTSFFQVITYFHSQIFLMILRQSLFHNCVLKEDTPSCLSKYHALVRTFWPIIWVHILAVSRKFHSFISYKCNHRLLQNYYEGEKYKQCRSICVKGGRHLQQGQHALPKTGPAEGYRGLFSSYHGYRAGLRNNYLLTNSLPRNYTISALTCQQKYSQEPQEQVFPSHYGYSPRKALIPSLENHTNTAICEGKGNKKFQARESMCSQQPISADHDPSFAPAQPITANQLYSLDL